MTRGMRTRLLAVACALVMASAASAADVVLGRPADLRADRYSDAPTLTQLPAGAHAELIATEAGWVQVRVGAQTGWLRATGLGGDAANVAALSQLETGRRASGNIVVAAGIRRIPKASKHALIIGVDAVTFDRAATSRWGGVQDDVESARMIAAQLGVPVDNVDVVSGMQATRVGIEQAFDRLNAQMQPGDEVLLYFSGPGARTVDDGSCASAWVTRDAATLTAATIVGRLRPSLISAGKVIVISDAAYGGDAVVPVGMTRLAATLPSARACKGAAQPSVMPIVDAATAIGALAQNLVHVQPSPGPMQGLQQAPGGGLFTQSLTDCLLGDATDLDGSASISMSELAACAQRGRFGLHRADVGPLVSVTGNEGYSPIVGVVVPRDASAPSSAVAATSAKAALEDLFGQRDGRIEVGLTATPSSLQVGRDALGLTVASNRPGYVYLVLLGSDGSSFYLLFPNDLDRDNRIAAGETLRLPRPNWRVQAQGPPGHDTVLAIVAESERDLAALATHKEGPFSTALTDAQGKAQLQWLLGRSGRAASAACVDGGARRNLAAVQVCSDAFGAAVIDIVER